MLCDGCYLLLFKPCVYGRLAWKTVLCLGRQQSSLVFLPLPYFYLLPVSETSSVSPGFWGTGDGDGSPCPSRVPSRPGLLFLS